MLNFNRRWPFGLTKKTWLDRATALILGLFCLVFVDAWMCQSAQAWPEVWRSPFAFVTDFGLSD